MKKLTEKQSAFCSEYVTNGYNGAKAYKDAYGQENNNVCKSKAYKMLRMAIIQEGIKNVELDYRITGHGLKINKVTILRVVKESLKAVRTNKEGGAEDDHAIRLKGVETYAKLVGDFSAEKRDVSFVDDTEGSDIKKMDKKEREAYKAKILAEL